MARSLRGPFISFVLVLASVVGVSLWWLQRSANRQAESALSQKAIPSGPKFEYSPPTPTPSHTPEASATAQPAISPVATLSPPPEPSQPTNELDQSFVGNLKLIIPVLGVKPDQLHDTFADARSEGRVHDAIDIPAPQGTPVIAAADGEIAKLFESVRGGTTIYQLSADKKLVYYYAHLQSYAPGLVTGGFAHQGDVIGYVGDTGNAGTGNYHLHFSITVIADPKRYWEGTNINPYPLLHR